MSMYRSLTAVALALACSVGLAIAPQASAELGDLTCRVSDVVATLHPPLLPGETSPVTIDPSDPQLTECFSFTGETMTSGTVHLNGVSAVAGSTGVLRCPVLVTFSGEVTITWDKGNPPSHGTVTLNTNPRNRTAVLDVRVTSGSLKDDRIIPLITVEINLDCIFVGLDTITVPAGFATFV